MSDILALVVAHARRHACAPQAVVVVVHTPVVAHSRRWAPMVDNCLVVGHCSCHVVVLDVLLPSQLQSKQVKPAGARVKRTG